MKRHSHLGIVTAMTSGVKAFLSLMVVAFCGKSLAAQGCASCYTTAAAGGSQTAHALRAGILLLAIPPALLFVGVIYHATRWNQRRTGVDPSLFGGANLQSNNVGESVDE